MIVNSELQRPGKVLFKAAIAVVLVGLLVLGAYLVLRPKPAAQAGTVVGFSAPPSVVPLKVVVLRGGTTGCRVTGGCNDANYAEVLSSREGWTTTVLAQGGTGYVGGAQKTPPTDFSSQLSDVYAANPDVVIVEGSVSDQYYAAADIQQAAVTVFMDLKAHLPRAKVVVVGPAWAGSPPANVAAVESAVKQAAIGRVALFIDPIAEGWFDGPNEALMAPDHQSPTDAGHALMASKIATDLAPLGLQGTTSSPAT